MVDNRGYEVHGLKFWKLWKKEIVMSGACSGNERCV